MRTFTAICVVSAIVHIVLLFAVATPYQRQTAHGETMSVELVSSDDAPPGNEGNGNDDSSAPSQQQQKPQAEETTPDFSKLRLSDTPSMPQDEQQKQAAAPPPEKPKQQQQQTQQPQTQQQQAQKSQGQAGGQQQSLQSATPPAQQSAQMQSMSQQVAPPPAPGLEAMQQMPEQPKVTPEMAVETPADQYERLVALMNIPVAGPTGYGDVAETKAKLTADEIAKFKTHLKTCWKLPAGVSQSDKVKVVIRVALRPDGVLADNPALIEAAASELGLPVYKSGVAALKQCAPYTMFPAEKYKEWRVLDINFSPDEMARG